jgi:hypothetical protein|tara:strand:+ start:10349 stop:10705 length:357 start_codon:yes stop_codon:yes gene_type:complete
MATITLTFANPVNASLQALSNTASRDNVYFKDTQNPPKTHFVGECTAISADKKTITVDVGSSTTRQTPGTSDFVFFGKNNKISTSALLGYYADVTMQTDQTTKMELFSVGSIISESSK